jgi:A/G-specific adenine glycosylase
MVVKISSNSKPESQLINQDGQLKLANVPWFQSRLRNWGSKNFINYPWREKHAPLHSLIVEILLQRTQANQVVPVFEKLVSQYPDIANIGPIREAQVRKLITSLGLPKRVKHITSLLRKLKKIGSVPNNKSDLLGLPGVGAYVASAYLSMHAKTRAPIIDSNVVRLYGRYFGLATGPESRRSRVIIDLAETLTPRLAFREFNYALLDLTKLICKTKPICLRCPIKKRCNYFIGLNLTEYYISKPG